MVRKAVLYVLAAGPVLLIGLIAINSRYNESHWEFVEYSPEATSRISAYVGPIKASRAHFASAEHKRCTSRCLAVDAWLAAKWSGQLKDVYPPTASYEDVSVVYGQLMAEKSEVVHEALRVADRLESQGFHPEAVFAYADVLDLADTGKFSEFGSLIDAASVQITVLNRIEKLTGTLSEDDTAHLMERLSVLDTSNRTLGVTIDRMTNAYRLDKRRQGFYSTTFQAAQVGGLLVSASDPYKDKIDSLQELVQTDLSAGTLTTQSQLAYFQNKRFLETLNKVRETLLVSSN